MTLQEHSQHLGGLVANLQSLEFILRLYFSQQPGARPFGLPSGTDLYSFPVGAEVPVNELTSYESLGGLIKRFNRSMVVKGLSPIDTDIVALRDAIAHERVSALVADEHLRLLKFEKPANGKARVTFNEVMDHQWFTIKKRKVYEATMFVHAQLAR